MPADGSVELRELARVCRQLEAYRRRAADLEQQRDDLIRQLREDGVAASTIATHAGVSQGRVTQIVGNGADRAVPR